MLQDGGALPKEEGDVRENKATHEENVLSSWRGRKERSRKENNGNERGD